MKRLRWLIPGLLVALSLTLVACGGDDDDDESNGGETPYGQTPTGNGDAPEGAWKGEFDTGTEVTIEIFVDPAGVPELAELEEFREAAEVPPVRYARVIAKNDSEDLDTARFATLTGEDGDQFSDDAIVLNFACSSAYRWLPEDTEPSEEAVALWNELFTGTCAGQELQGPQIPGGETVTYFVVYEGEGEPEFERVFMGLGREFER